MSLLQQLTLMATQAPEATAVALLVLDSTKESFILVTGPSLAPGRTKDPKVRAFVANVFVTLLEKLGEDEDESVRNNRDKAPSGSRKESSELSEMVESAGSSVLPLPSERGESKENSIPKET